MKRLRAYLLAAVTATAVVAALPGAVAAAEPDGAYARFNFGGGEGGLVFLSYTGATTVNAGVLGLLGSAEYFLHGSSQNCSHAPSPANNAFHIKGMTDDDGVLWMRRSPTIDLEVHSIWLGPTGGSEPPVCANAFNWVNYGYVGSGDWNGDAILGIWDKEHVLSLLVRRPDNRARLSIVVDGMAGDDMVTVRGVNRRCGTHPTHSSFMVTFDRPVDAGAFKSRVISITPDEMGMIRSERAIFQASRECANIIGVLVAL